MGNRGRITGCAETYIYAVFIIKTIRNYTRTMVSFTVMDPQSNIGPTKLN